MLVELPQLFLDLTSLSPDSPVDHAVFKISKMHDPRKIFTQSHRVDNSEIKLPGRGRGQKTQNNIIKRSDRSLTACNISISLEKNGSITGQLQSHGNVNRPGVRELQL